LAAWLSTYDDNVSDDVGRRQAGPALQHGHSQEQDWRHGSQPAQQVYNFKNLFKTVFYKKPFS